MMMMTIALSQVAAWLNQQACIVEEPRNRGHYDAVIMSASFAREIEAACRKAQDEIEQLRIELARYRMKPEGD